MGDIVEDSVVLKDTEDPDFSAADNLWQMGSLMFKSLTRSLEFESSK